MLSSIFIDFGSGCECNKKKWWKTICEVRIWAGVAMYFYEFILHIILCVDIGVPAVGSKHTGAPEIDTGQKLSSINK